jgi:histidinol-phosphate aminotransferase
MGWTVLPSRANFILAAAPDGNGQSAYLGLKARGILVRYFDKPGLRDKIRISIGTKEENDALLAALKAMRQSVNT